MSLPHTTCGTLALLASGALPTADLPDLPPPDDGLLVRDAMDNTAGSAESAHFAYRWGPEDRPSEAEIEVVLAGAELAWETQFEALGFVPPPTSDVAKINIYQGSTGLLSDGAPLPDVADAYASLDPEGWPMIVVSSGAWATDAAMADAGEAPPGEYIQIALAHELQHAAQSHGAVFATPAHLWFFEGLAEWAAFQSHPGAWSVEMDVAFLALTPQLPWQWFDAAVYPGTRFDPDDPAPESIVHVYATWVLLQSLADDFGPGTVVDLAAPDDPRPPMERIADRLADADATPLDALATTWARARTDELSDAAHLRAFFELVLEPGIAEGYPDFEPIAGTLALDAAPVAPPARLRPGRLGTNRWLLPDPPPTLVVTLDGDPAGSAGTPTAWRVVAVFDRPGDAGDTWAAVTPGAPFDVPHDAAGVELFVLTGGDAYVVGEVFDYRIAAIQPGEEPRGCCSTAPGRPLPWLALLVLPAAVLRRRR